MKVHCAVCGRLTAGMKGKGASSKKSVSRRFGCMLCAECLRVAVMEANRVNERRKTMEEVDMCFRKYVQQLVA